MKHFYPSYWFLRKYPSNVFFLLVSIFGTLIVSSSHLQAQAINVTGNQTLTVTTAIIGSEPTAVVNSASTLSYKRQSGVITKITVATACPSQSFTLKVLAVSPTAGTAAPEVTLTDGMLAVDFITGIPASPSAASRTATLQYTASATFAQGNSTEFGNDIHTVTYTLVAQ